MWFATYSVCKIAAEGVARTTARLEDLPTTIARLNVPYGDNGGWPAFHLEMILADQPVPVHPEAPNLFNPIHDDDIVRQLDSLLDAATVPATIVNWGGSEQVSIEEWSAYLGELAGRDAKFATHRPDHRQRHHRHHQDGEADRPDRSGLARRLQADGCRATSRAAT